MSQLALRTLHVSAVGADVRKAHERLEVWFGKARVGSVRLYDLEAVHLYGRSHLSAAALQACMQSQVRVCWYSKSRLVARCEPESASHVLTRMAQVDRWRDPAQRLLQSQSIVAAKIAGQQTLQQRWRQSSSVPQVRQALVASQRVAATCQQGASQASNLDALRGWEGTASAAHFAALGAVLGNSAAASLGFAGRNARPPRDPVNALLSFGYVLLASELAGLLAGTGIDPAIGWLHGLRSGRDSLALDAMEPYRAPVVDALAVKLLGRGTLTEADFAPGAGGGVYLTPEGRKRFLVQWEEWLRAPNRGAVQHGGVAPAAGPTDSWRHALRGQAVAFRRAILYGEAPAWYHDTEAGDDAGIDIVAPRTPGGEQAPPGEDDERF